MPTRVVHIIIDLRTGGAELMLKRLVAAERSSSEFEHRVISLRTLGTVGPELQDICVPVEALGMCRPLDIPRVLIRLTRRLRQLKPDVVQTWMYHADLLGGLASRIAGARKLAWGIRIADISVDLGVRRSTMFVRWLCARLSRAIPARIVYVAHSSRTTHEALGYASDKGVVIPNGYELPKDLPREKLRSELGLVDDVLILGTASRFSPQKDPKGLIAIVSALAASDPRLHLVMVGRGFTTGNAELMGWIADGGQADRIHLLGERDDLQSLLAGMDIFCLNSLGEGFPNVIAEAMSVGVPCVATDVGDTAFLLADAGLVVPARDPDAFRTAVATLIAERPEVRQGFGQRGRQRIADHFSLESVVLRYEEMYRQLGGGSPRRRPLRD